MNIKGKNLKLPIPKTTENPIIADPRNVLPEQDLQNKFFGVSLQVLASECVLFNIQRSNSFPSRISLRVEETIVDLTKLLEQQGNVAEAVELEMQELRQKTDELQKAFLNCHNEFEGKLYEIGILRQKFKKKERGILRQLKIFTVNDLALV